MIMKDISHYIKHIGRRFGLEVCKYNVYSSHSLQLQKLLSYNKIETIIDIGANAGRYAIDIRTNGFKGRIISFEPLSDAYNLLKKNSREDAEWIVPGRMALGNENGEIEINVSANSESSSILPMTESHVKAAPESVYIKKEVIPIRRLDSIAIDLNLKGNIYLKIDVQGFELDVLKGASDLLSKTKGLQLELSLTTLYDGQLLMGEMVKYVEDLGFELNALFPIFIDESSGRLLQTDGVFFKFQS